MLVSIREILQRPGDYQGWLHLPARPWNLDTLGVFVVFDKDALPDADPRPEIAKAGGWIEVLDAPGIEDIVENARAQLVTPMIDDLFAAFQFYVEHDAFIIFEPPAKSES